MENQGKRNNQIKYSEDASFWALIGLFTIIIYIIAKN